MWILFQPPLHPNKSNDYIGWSVARKSTQQCTFVNIIVMFFIYDVMFYVYKGTPLTFHNSNKVSTQWKTLQKSTLWLLKKRCNWTAPNRANSNLLFCGQMFCMRTKVCSSALLLRLNIYFPHEYFKSQMMLLLRLNIW